MTSEYIVEIENVTKVIGQSEALAEVSLAILPGEIHALVGEPGAGKTTLMKILGGLYPASTYSGRILIAGEPVTLASPADAGRRGIAIVPRRPGIFPSLSVAENIMAGRWQSEQGFFLRPRHTEVEARGVAEVLGLKLDLTQPARYLTPGQRQLVVMARALAMAPKLVVLDEPSTFLTTAAEVGSLMRAVRLLAERGIACLYLVRRVAEATQIADRATALRDGRINGTWARADFDEQALAAAILSQRIGGQAYVDYDEEPDAGGWWGQLRSLLTGRRR